MSRRTESKEGKREVISCRISPESFKKLNKFIAKRKKENIRYNLGRAIDELIEKIE